MFSTGEVSWSVALVAASSFLGLFVTVILGVLAALWGQTVPFEYYGLATVCAVSFIAHLRA